MSWFLSQLKDPGPTYVPPRIGLKITSTAIDLRSTVVAKRDGSATVYLRRATDCWDPIEQRRLTVKEIPVTVTTAKGTRKFLVDHKVRAVQL